MRRPQDDVTGERPAYAVKMQDRKHPDGPTAEVVDWPGWIPVAMAVAASAASVAAVFQRQPQGDLTLPAVYSLIAISPFLLDVIDALTPLRVALPLPVFPVPVLIGTGLLLSRPAPVDFSATILVFMTAEVVSRAMDHRWLSFAAPLASVALLAGVDIFGLYDDSFPWLMGFCFAGFGGFLIQTLGRKTAELKAAHDELAERSATEERQRIAREIHDVIAHSMSVTMLHVSAARMALERDRTDDALEALREAEQQGRNALNEIRRTVGLLGPEEAATAAPMPSATDLRKLVDDFRTAGLDVELDTHGDIESLPAAAGLNLYRIVQESLTNAAKHAPGASVSVELDVTDVDIQLRVHNGRGNGARPEARSGGGLGLKGMAGRAAMLGGSLAADDDENGWTVRLVAPRRAGEDAPKVG